MIGCMADRSSTDSDARERMRRWRELNRTHPERMKWWRENFCGAGPAGRARAGALLGIAERTAPAMELGHRRMTLAVAIRLQDATAHVAATAAKLGTKLPIRCDDWMYEDDPEEW